MGLMYSYEQLYCARQLRRETPSDTPVESGDVEELTNTVQ